MKDYLDAEGAVSDPVTPRQVIKEAFAARVVPDGQVWIDMLDHRNLRSHPYDAAVFDLVVATIAERYLAALRLLAEYLAAKDTP
jgi:nucleotidyltransferase substrate binding protein (TIGR01987 family)